MELEVTDYNIANNFFKRAFGCLVMKLPILLPSCNCVHTFFLKENFDIIFLDKNNVILKIVENTKTNRIYFCKNSNKVFELKSGFIKSAKIKPQDKLVFKACQKN